jgi:hypothetical protein
MPTDTTLGDTLGNLGASLSQALNPMNMIRAQDIQAQVQQRQWEIHHQQQLDAANANAAEVYGNANPHGLSPADLEVAKAQIRNGNFNASQTIDALKAAGGYAANQAAAGMIDATHPEWSDGQRASAKADILSGRKSLAEVENDYATAASNTNKATATIGATNTARTATTGPNADLAAAAAAGGDETGASKLIAQGNELTAPVISGPLGDANVQAQIDKRRTEQAIAGTTPPAGQPVSSGLAAPTAVADITQKNIVAQSAPRAPSAIVSAVPPVDPLTGQPVTVAPGATPPSGVFSQPAQGPNAAATAETAAAEATGKAGSEYANSVLQGGIQEGQGAQKVLNDVNQLRQLAKLMNNETPWEQLQNKISDNLYQHLAITATPGQSAREVFNNYVAGLMGEWRKDVGVQRLALPEIQLGSLSLPNANMSLDALNNALDNVQAKATISDKVGRKALQYWADQSRPIEQRANDFLGERDKLYDPAANPTPAIKKERTDKETVNSPTGPQQYRIINGQRVPWPPKQ